MSIQNQKGSSIQDIYKSRKVLISYLKQQGYATSAHESTTMSEISTMVQTTKETDKETCLDFEVHKENDNETKCHVFYYLKPSSIKQNTLNELVLSYFDDEENMDKSKLTFVLVMHGNVNDTVKKTVKNLWKKYQEYAVVFEIRSLMFNVFDHIYVPEHVKLTTQEKEQLYQTMNIKEDSQLPEISMFDAVAKAMFLKPGEVCKIKRYDKISFQNDYYRICVI
mgnify:FL=1|tara:strand:- start:16079 stop:16747 length:669 start_codon:yes stop_codon:yes gene_type:complete